MKIKQRENTRTYLNLYIEINGEPTLVPVTIQVENFRKLKDSATDPVAHQKYLNQKKLVESILQLSDQVDTGTEHELDCNLSLRIRKEAVTNNPNISNINKVM